ncbi:MAG: hypothetical protein AAF328_03700 [Planctomycetota bacterium]
MPLNFFHRPCRSAVLATSVTAAFAAMPTSLSAQDLQPFQRAVGVAPTFHASGSGTDARLASVEMTNGDVFTEYYRPIAVHDFRSHREAGTSVRLLYRIDDGRRMAGKQLGRFVSDGPTRQVTAADRVAFADALTRAFASPYLNDYFDTHYHDAPAGQQFDFILEFDHVLMDNDAGPDDFTELLWFERGPDGGNSWLTLQAVDQDGNALGPPLAVGPDETKNMTPRTIAAQSGQPFGATGVDLSRLGVSETRYLRVRQTQSGDSGYTGGGDANPDFKFMAVITNEEQLEEILDPPAETKIAETQIGTAFD